MKVRIGRYPKNGDRHINIEIEYFDTWSLDHTLALIILPSLIQLKNAKHGIPNSFATVGGEDWDNQDSFDFYKESNKDAWAECEKRWDEVLDKMIWSFQQIAIDDYNDKYFHGKAVYDFVKVKGHPLHTMVDTNPDEHWVDTNGLNEHEARIQEGLELFGKYYRSLWD